MKIGFRSVFIAAFISLVIMTTQIIATNFTFVATISDDKSTAGPLFFVVGCTSSLLSFVLPFLIGALYPVLERNNPELNPKVGALGGTLAIIVSTIIANLITYVYFQLVLPQIYHFINPNITFDTIRRMLLETQYSTGVAYMSILIGGVVLNSVFAAIGGFVGTYFVIRKKQ